MSEPVGGIFFYSRNGHTRRAAEALADRTGAMLIEWTSNKYWVPGLGYIRAGLDSLRDARPAGATGLPDLTPYAWLVVAGPVWAGRPAAPLATLIEETRGFIGPAAIMLTSGDPKSPTQAFDRCDQIRAQPFSVKAHIPNGIDGQEEMERRLEQLAEALDVTASEAAE